MGDSTAHLPKVGGTSAGCTYWAPERTCSQGDYSYGVHFARRTKTYGGKSLSTSLTLHATKMEGSDVSYPMLELKLPDPNWNNPGENYVFKGVSAAMSLLAPTGDPKEGIFLDLIINVRVNKWKADYEDSSDTFGFYAARAKVNSNGYFDWIYNYKFNFDENMGLS